MDDTIWGVNQKGEVYQRVNEKWQLRPGRMSQVAVGNAKDIWAVDDRREYINGMVLRGLLSSADSPKFLSDQTVLFAVLIIKGEKTIPSLSNMGLVILAITPIGKL